MTIERRVDPGERVDGGHRIPTSAAEPLCPIPYKLAAVDAPACGSQGRSDRRSRDLVRPTLRIRWISDVGHRS